MEIPEEQSFITFSDREVEVYKIHVAEYYHSVEAQESYLQDIASLDEEIAAMVSDRHDRYQQLFFHRARAARHAHAVRAMKGDLTLREMTVEELAEYMRPLKESLNGDL
jgi:galactose-1-phosphate uridylyltransferase